MTEFNPQKYGFNKQNEETPLYWYETKDFLLSFTVNDDHLTIFDTHGTVISTGKIPANNQSLALLLKAFAINRPKT